MKPLTRKEMLLDGAAKGNLDTFKPATREEVFAKRALANADGSGGGSGGVFYVDVTWDEENPDPISNAYPGTSSKTLAEIIEAAQNGMSVIARQTISHTDSGGAYQFVNYYPLSNARLRDGVGTNAVFENSGYDGECIWGFDIVIEDDGKVEVYYHETELAGTGPM